ncbi:MAG: hypothetical protein AAGM67_09165 [Bacteroidota bacterium]
MSSPSTHHPSREIILALLPLQQLAADPDIRFYATRFAEGLAEQLAHYRTIHLIYLRSSNNKHTSQQLSVDYWIKGSFRLLGKQARIGIQLQRGDDQQVAFAERYHASLDNLNSLQEQIVGQIVRHVQAAPVQHHRPLTPQTTDTHTPWLPGMTHLKQGADQLGIFLQQIAGQGRGETASPNVSTHRLVFRQQSERWEIGYQIQAGYLRDQKGFHDIRRLLARPHQEIHCLELMDAAWIQQHDTLSLDAKTKRNYQERILHLQESMRQAEEKQAYQQAARLKQEYEQLLAHLSSALGLGQKAYQQDSPTEKARALISHRIKKAFRSIKKENAALAQHLENSIQTGVFCMYGPQHIPQWNL